MSGGVILLLIIVVVSRLVLADQQKKKQEARRRAQQAQQAQQPQPQPQRQRPRAVDIRFPDLDAAGTAPRPVDARFPELDREDVAPRPPRPKWDGNMARDSAEGAGGGSLAGASEEGSSFGGSLAGDSTEGSTFGGSLSTGAGKGGMRTAPIQSSMRQSPRHVVKSMTQSEHLHTESSLTGIAPDCEEDARVMAADAQTLSDETAYNIAGEAARRQFAFDAHSVVQGFLYGEILGKPKAMRARR